MEKLDRKLLMQVKRAFVPQGGGAEPVAGASQMTAAMGAPVGSPPGGGDPNAMGGDPNAQPAPMPPSGMDPAMAGMVGGGAPGDPNAPKPQSTMTLTIDDLIKLLKVLGKQPGAEGGAPAPAAAAPAQQSGDPRIDHIIELLHAQMGRG